MILVYFSESNRGWETNVIYGLGILLTEFLPINNNFKYLKIDVVMMLYCIIHIALRLFIRFNRAKIKRLQSSFKKNLALPLPHFYIRIDNLCFIVNSPSIKF